ncbi:putative sensor domain DACNV-containing protein [Hymenobacter sp. YC55]|uniref:putative sensor domain DACNV-containing protein n=1 Tax=Hymenobacter sp. YC55 TaxID=3034019 RepID=UPI0023F67932|nr:hypothetical protein [Hymenobacter sp. YC55]MDF7813904.1 hypothetical protein [Hymenobacter sp. YC55]
MPSPLHYYPADLAVALQQHWPPDAPPLPATTVLTAFLSTLYQASMLAEEGRPVVCHLVLATQAELAAQAETLTDFHLLRFAEPRSYSEQELRRLSPAVQQASSLLAVAPTPQGDLYLWGMLFSEHEWDQFVDRPRLSTARPPRALLVQVNGPGNLVFYDGAHRILTLQRGRVDGHGFLSFPLAWIQGRIVISQRQAGQDLLPEERELFRHLILQLQRRTLTRIRASGHGALIVMVPADRIAALTAPGGVLCPKYPVLLGKGTSARFPALVQAVIRRLAALGEVSWAHYQRTHDADLLALSAEIEHLADYLAGLAAVDGALVLTQLLDLVGFGVEIQATQVSLERVYRALDLEAQERQAVAVDHGGTRHRAAYRLCLAAPECLAIIVSQDGGVQFVGEQAGQVVVWDQLTY